jgi:hypothetical protein
MLRTTLGVTSILKANHTEPEPMLSAELQAVCRSHAVGVTIQFATE